MTVSSFTEFCSRGMCLRGSIKSRNCEEEWRRKECYEKYVERQAALSAKPVYHIKPGGRTSDPKWARTRQAVMARDGGTCRLSMILSEPEYASMAGSPGIGSYHYMSQVVDPAHIFPAGSHPEIMYEEWNVIALNRFFHTRLDELKHPLTGKPISSRERLQWMLYARDGIWYIM